ncbi:hypothetical protein [Spiroplasma endosymbiont of Aspidapion aeneum]
MNWEKEYTKLIEKLQGLNSKMVNHKFDFNIIIDAAIRILLKAQEVIL